MFVKKLLNITVPVLLLFAFKGNSQVVTSKKEAVKKGIYKKPAGSQENVSEDVKSTLTAFTANEKPKVNTTPAVPANKPQPTATVKQQPKVVAQKPPKSKRTLIKETDDKDLLPSPE